MRTRRFHADAGALKTWAPAKPLSFVTVSWLQAMAPQHPGWRSEEPYRSALAGDMASVFAQQRRSKRDEADYGHARRHERGPIRR